MATYVIVFKKPKTVGGKLVLPENKPGEAPVTSLKDYRDIRNIFQSNLLVGDKVICSHNLEGDETELIYNKTLEGKKKVCFTGMKFTGNSLRREVPVDRLDKDTIVFFIDSNEILQNIINRAGDGDVISLLDNIEIPSPLTCPDDKKIEIDLCGCNISYQFDGEITSSPNITIKNSIQGQGVINKGYSSVNNGEIHTVDQNTQTVAEVVAAANAGDVVVLPAGEYAGDLNLNKGITICGVYDAETGEYADVTLSGKIAITAETGTVELRHVKIGDNTSAEGTGSGKTTAKGRGVEISGGCDVTLKACTVDKMDNYYSVMLVDTAGKVVIEDCVFDVNNSYNCIEFNIKTVVADGTTIKNCTFKEGCCSHCAVSMYSYEDGATVNFIGNTLEHDDNQFRFSNANDAHVTINMTDNVWLKTGAYDAAKYFESGQCTSKVFAGLFFFQQYLETMDLSKMTVNAKNNKFNDVVLTKGNAEVAEEALYYVFMDKAAWIMSRPTVNILQ